MVMDIARYEDEIIKLWPKPGQRPSKDVMDVCLAAVSEFPSSSGLWYSLGMAMCRSGDAYGYTPEDYLRCFENAVACDPDNAEAHQELGYILDTHYDDYERAEVAFRKAIELGAEQESHCSLARVLAQVGKVDEAIEGLSERACAFYDHPEVRLIRSEILAGDWTWEMPANPGERKGGRRDY
jgi:tetratricopeptide (TPR) repeat protein